MHSWVLSLFAVEVFGQRERERRRCPEGADASHQLPQHLGN